MAGRNRRGAPGPAHAGAPRSRLELSRRRRAPSAMGPLPAVSEAEFDAHRRAGCTHVPLLAAMPAGTLTGARLYAPLAGRPGAYLLESGEPGTPGGRYSIVGLPGAAELRCRDGRFQVLEDGAVREEAPADDPLARVEAWLDRHRVAPARPALPFSGGLVGYFGYDLVRTIEPVLAGGRPPDPLGLPELWLLRSTELFVLDHRTRELLLAVTQPTEVPDAYAAGRRRLAELREQAAAAPALPPAPAPGADGGGGFESGFTEAGFRAAVTAARERIAAGDLMQAVLSQRLSRPYAGRAFDLYRGLLALNPSPYMYCLDFGAVQVVGSSPEILVRRQGPAVTVRPIAGTRPRGAGAAADRRLERELLADPKERAEHLMLIDLGRNDLGRVSAPGSVLLTERMVVERYSHVMHMVSNVEGRLPPGTRTGAVLRATFPAGTVSGAPKVRAMQLIDELEPVARGIYAGAVGYFGWDRNLDAAIAIRTAVLHGGRMHVQAGAGIVYDSAPEREWRETMHKAQALLQAAGPDG